MSMTQEMQELHREASRVTGRDLACGTKVDYVSESTAARAAVAMNKRMTRVLEPYPCHWCKGWHIGRTMSPDEMREIIAKNA